MEILLIWLLFGIFAAMIASHKGRSGAGWFFLGLFIGPFALVVALLPSADEQAQHAARLTGHAQGYKKCPACAEAVRRDAVKCRYCQSDLRAPVPVPAALPPGVTEAQRDLSMLRPRCGICKQDVPFHEFQSHVAVHTLEKLSSS